MSTFLIKLSDGLIASKNYWNFRINMFILYTAKKFPPMHLPLTISTMRLSAASPTGSVVDMSGRCAFALCTKGDFTISILNEQYAVSERCLFACMPFVNIEIVSVAATSEVTFGYIALEDVPRMINRWVNTSNLSLIQSHPLIKISQPLFNRLTVQIDEFLKDRAETDSTDPDHVCHKIQQDIVNLSSSLIIAQVLKIYFTTLPVEAGGISHRDIVFHRFLLALYANFREHREVRYYALRSGVSIKYFSTIIRQISGNSPSDWIETVVAGEAKAMLADSHRSVKNIATSLNFPDAPTFTKYFRRVTGLTPKAYRKTIS